MNFSGWVAQDLKIPKHHTDMRNMFMGFGDKVIAEIKSDIDRRLAEDKRFCVSADEWTSNANRRYMAIELHTADKVRINLGMRRIDKELPAIKAADMLVKVLAEYGLNIKRHIVCFISDGASVMKACGRILDCWHQVCIDHGIHLSVQEIYKQSNDDSDLSDVESGSDSENDEENGDAFSVVENRDKPVLNSDFKSTVGTVRNIAKFFKRSSAKQEYLDDERLKVGKNKLTFIIDTPTRWNSTFFMLERYLELRTEADTVLIEYNKDEWCLSSADVRQIELLTEALGYFEKLSTHLCERDITLTKADKLCDF